MAKAFGVEQDTRAPLNRPGFEVRGGTPRRRGIDIDIQGSLNKLSVRAAKRREAELDAELGASMASANEQLSFELNPAAREIKRKQFENALTRKFGADANSIIRGGLSARQLTQRMTADGGLQTVDKEGRVVDEEPPDAETLTNTRLRRTGMRANANFPQTMNAVGLFFGNGSRLLDDGDLGIAVSKQDTINFASSFEKFGDDIVDSVSNLKNAQRVNAGGIEEFQKQHASQALTQASVLYSSLSNNPVMQQLMRERNVTSADVTGILSALRFDLLQEYGTAFSELGVDATTLQSYIKGQEEAVKLTLSSIDQRDEALAARDGAAASVQKKLIEDEIFLGLDKDTQKALTLAPALAQTSQNYLNIAELLELKPQGPLADRVGALFALSLADPALETNFAETGIRERAKRVENVGQFNQMVEFIGRLFKTANPDPVQVLDLVRSSKEIAEMAQRMQEFFPNMSTAEKERFRNSIVDLEKMFGRLEAFDFADEQFNADLKAGLVQGRNAGKLTEDMNIKKSSKEGITIMRALIKGLRGKDVLEEQVEKRTQPIPKAE